jgi:uncharacterized membrane protein YqiK
MIVETFLKKRDAKTAIRESLKNKTIQTLRPVTVSKTHQKMNKERNDFWLFENETKRKKNL